MNSETHPAAEQSVPGSPEIPGDPDAPLKLFLTGASGFIGTNVISLLPPGAFLVQNFDRSPPLNSTQQDMWVQGDIMDREALISAVKTFRPDVVIHMAARVDTGYGEMNLERDYDENITGTANLLEAVRAAGTVQRLVVTSSQFVVGPGDLPKDDLDFRPHTVYGESKVITEQLTREADLGCWTLIRPTNVWGPYHERYSREFWKILRKGLYIHPAVPSPTRSYGYVGNVAWQLLEIVRAPEEKVSGQVFYLGDRPINIRLWIDGFYKALSPRKRMLQIPYPLMKILAFLGDGISKLTGKTFYITRSRLNSMMTDYKTPMKKTFSTFGEPPYSLEEGIRITSEWFTSR